MMDARFRHIVLVPLLVWVGLLLLLGVSIAYAYWPGGVAKFGVGLAIAMGKAALIGAIFMQLRRSSAIVHLAAASGVTWLTFLFLFSFADFLTR